MSSDSTGHRVIVEFTLTGDGDHAEEARNIEGDIVSTITAMHGEDGDAIDPYLDKGVRVLAGSLRTRPFDKEESR